jgi:tripartite-type tricarboxylate transporter receptor subunit TctC
LAGRLRWVATTGRKRSALVHLPTVAESGLPGYEVTQWYGLITSAKVAQPIVKKLYAASAEALQAPDVVERLSADGSDIVASTPEQFGAHIKAEIAKWTKLVKETNLKLQ